MAFVPKAESIAILANPENPDFASIFRDVEGAERSLKVVCRPTKFPVRQRLMRHSLRWRGNAQMRC